MDSVETCRQYLAAHDWDVERAIETAFISDIDLPSTTNENDRITTDQFPSPSAPPMPESDLDADRPTTATVNHYNTTNPIL